jgi:hypothetical protein
MKTKIDIKFKSQVTAENIEVGRKAFKVWSLGEGSFKAPFLIEAPEDEKGFIQVSIKYVDEWFSNEISLQDMNAIPNGYNNHLAFYDEQEADMYLIECKTNPALLAEDEERIIRNAQEMDDMFRDEY